MYIMYICIFIYTYKYIYIYTYIHTYIHGESERGGFSREREGACLRAFLIRRGEPLKEGPLRIVRQGAHMPWS